MTQTRMKLVSAAVLASACAFSATHSGAVCAAGQLFEIKLPKIELPKLDIEEEIRKASAAKKREEMMQWPVENVLRYLESDPEAIEQLFPSLAPDRKALAKKLAEARKEVTKSSLPLASYDAMVAEITASFRTQIIEIASKTPAAGADGKYAFVIGDFRNRVTGKPQWLNDTLRTVAITLSNDESLPKNISIVLIGDYEPEKIINRVASATDYIAIDESNIESLRMVKFHPHDVYVLSGSMSERPDAKNYRVEFVVSAELNHPQGNRLVKGAQSRQIGYVYHPIREAWITDAENRQLANALQAKK
jgi:hypothetical protein